MGKSITLINWYGMSNTISSIKYKTSSSSWRVEGEDSLNSEIVGRNLECFKSDFCHFLSVCLGITRSFSEKGRMLVWWNSEFIIEAMMPNFFHVIPVVNDTVLDGVSEFENSLLGLGFFSDVAVFVHTNHDIFILRSSDNWGEGWSGGIITWQSSFAHSWSIVNNYGNSFLFWHGNKNFYRPEISSTQILFRLYCIKYFKNLIRNNCTLERLCHWLKQIQYSDLIKN